jgi:hypothetical protein
MKETPIDAPLSLLNDIAIKIIMLIFNLIIKCKPMVII